MGFGDVTQVGFSSDKVLGQAMTLLKRIEENGISGRSFMSEVQAAHRDLGLTGGEGSRTFEVASAGHHSSVAPSSAVSHTTRGERSV